MTRKAARTGRQAKRMLAFVALVLGTSLAAVLLPVLVAYLWTADLFYTLWRYLWK